MSQSGRPLAGVPVQVTVFPRTKDTEVGESVDLAQLDPVLTNVPGHHI